ncbi:hypothetical protein D3C84_802850 [compost metagenome]
MALSIVKATQRRQAPATVGMQDCSRCVGRGIPLKGTAHHIHPMAQVAAQPGEVTAQERYRLHDAIQAIVIGLPDQAFQRADTRARTLDVVGHDQGRRFGHGQIQVIGFVVTQCVV